MPTDSTATSNQEKRLTEESMSQNLRRMEYAVRGAVVIAANKINDELRASGKTKKYPFDKIIYTNIGNPHSIQQKPLTWPRQVLALVDLPEEVGVDHPDVHKLFPADAIRRAKEIKVGLSGHGSGAYSHSKVRTIADGKEIFERLVVQELPSWKLIVFFCICLHLRP